MELTNRTNHVGSRTVAWGEVSVTQVVVRLQLPQLPEARPGRSPVTRSTEGLCRAGLHGYRAGMWRTPGRELRYSVSSPAEGLSSTREMLECESVLLLLDKAALRDSRANS